MRPIHLQALFARRREIEHNRIERTEAVSKYFDRWGKITARFENWTTPEYYKQAEKQLEYTRELKEKQKRLAERQQKLAKLLEMEKKMHEQELREKERNPRRSMDTEMMEKINENLKEQQQMRRKLDLESKLYGKWRHGVDDDNLVFESKTDNEVMAKLNWLDKQVDQQLQREKEQEKAKEQELKLRYEMNKTEELQKERQQIREKEIREIRCLQEYHMEKIRECQQETDALKEQERQMKTKLEDLEKELELLQENYAVVEKDIDFGEAYNFNKVKILMRKRSEEFRNQIKLCLSILERTLDFAEKPEVLNSLKNRLETELKNETHKLTEIESMYESEAKYSLRRNEKIWQTEHAERYKLIKQALMEEHQLVKSLLNDIMKKHEEFLELRSTHLNIVENSSEKLKLLIQEEENSPRHQSRQANNSPNGTKHIQCTNHQASENVVHTQLEESDNSSLYSPHRQASSFTDHQKLAVSSNDENDLSYRRNCDESNDNNMSPRCYNSNDCNNINQVSNSFNNLNLDAWQTTNPSHRELESQKMNAQRSMQVVTAETEAERPRFGRKRSAWN